MDISAWTTKERCMAAFWLICAVFLAVTIYAQAGEAEASASLKSLGLLALVISWSLSPKFFLQPLGKRNPVQKPLIFGMVTFFAFQMASLVV
jgi:hypothetical protein